MTSFTPLVVSPPDVDPLEFMIRTIEIKVHEGGWDGPNRIFFLEPAPDLAADMKGVAVWEMPPLMEDAVTQMHPAHMLGFAAALIRTVGIPAPVFAVALVMESWMVAFDPDASPAEQAQLDADREARRLHTRADRIEMRLAHLVTVGGDREVMLARLRDGEPTVMDDEDYGGVVPDALRRFVQVVQTAGGGR